MTPLHQDLFRFLRAVFSSQFFVFSEQLSTGRICFCPRRGAENGKHLFVRGGRGGARRTATATPFVRGGRGGARRTAYISLSAEGAEGRGERPNCFCPRRNAENILGRYRPRGRLDCCCLGGAAGVWRRGRTGQAGFGVGKLVGWRDGVGRGKEERQGCGVPGALLTQISRLV